MLDKLDEWGPVTVLLVGLTLLVVGGGVAVVIVNPDTYSFSQLLDDLKAFALALGGLGIGRGIMAGLTNAGIALNVPGNLPPDEPEDAPPQEIVPPERP